MSVYLEIDPTYPKSRSLEKVVRVIQDGGVIVYPTDSVYALGCKLSTKSALNRIRRIRKLSEKHQFTIMCNDLSSLSKYALVSNRAYRILKAHTPGPYTFILKARPRVPRHLMYVKKRTIGVRVPETSIASRLVSMVGEPILSTSLILPSSDIPLASPYDIRLELDNSVDLIVAGGEGGSQPTSVIDLAGDIPRIQRKGLGEVTDFKFLDNDIIR